LQQKFAYSPSRSPILAALIVAQPIRKLQDFDQPFYVTLAYDLDRHGVFTNGPFSGVDDTVTVPLLVCFSAQSIRLSSPRRCG